MNKTAQKTELNSYPQGHSEAHPEHVWDDCPGMGKHCAICGKRPNKQEVKLFFAPFTRELHMRWALELASQEYDGDLRQVQI